MEDGIQPLEALIFIINKINQQGILNGFQIKLMVLDSCDNAAIALEKSLAFIKGKSSLFKIFIKGRQTYGMILL